MVLRGRMLRLPVQDPTLNDKLHSFNYKGYQMTNLEMETSAIYGLSKLLGHQAVSLNAIIANRAAGTFTKDTKKVVENLIVYGLEQFGEEMKKAPLTGQELHNLAMNIVGNALRDELQWEFLLVNSELKRDPQFVCVDKKQSEILCDSTIRALRRRP